MILKALYVIQKTVYAPLKTLFVFEKKILHALLKKKHNKNCLSQSEYYICTSEKTTTTKQTQHVHQRKRKEEKSTYSSENSSICASDNSICDSENYVHVSVNSN